MADGDVCILASDGGQGGGSSSSTSSSSTSSSSTGSSSTSSTSCTSGQAQACYDGAPSTKDVGVCHGGTQFCVGGSWGPCVGEVTPSAEICDGLDNDCDGVIDDGNPGGGAGCSTGLLGACAAGTTACMGGQHACIQNLQPSPEVCNNGIDDNCDGAVDEGCNNGRVQFVSPYVGIANRPGRLIARGLQFTSGGPTATVVVGAMEIGPLALDSDSQFTVDYPGLPAGNYPVSLKGSGTTVAELVVLVPPAMSPGAIPAPSARERLVYDAERQTLYAVNRIDQEIERYHYDGSSWTVLSPHVLPQLTDLDLAPNGRSLIVSSRGAIHDISLTSPIFAATLRAVNPDTFCGQFLARLAVVNDGEALVVSQLDQCSGSSDSYRYNILTYSLTTNPYPQGMLYNGMVAASLDGSRVYMGENGLSPAPDVQIFNALTSTITTSSVSDNLYAASVSADASRVILQNEAVYSRSLSLTGNVPSGGVVLASRDASRAFVYRDDGGQPRVVIHDLNGALLPGAIYPTLKTINLPSSPNTISGSLWDISMTSTPDDAVVFVSGDAQILIVPVD